LRMYTLKSRRSKFLRRGETLSLIYVVYATNYENKSIFLEQYKQ